MVEAGDQDMFDEPEVVGPVPPNGSKSLVTGRKGFSAHFKNVAAAQLLTHVKFPILLTKAISLNESYEAACISRLVAIYASGLHNTLAEIVWMPQSLRAQELGALNLRLEFLLGKARQTPNVDQWKNWSGDFQKVYLSKYQRKKQQTGHKLALVSLADMDEFHKTAQRPENAGRKYDL